LIDSIHFLSAFLSLALDLDQLLTSEYLDISQNLILSQVKVKRLEQYAGSTQSHLYNPLIPAYTMANAEKDELAERLR
jgi:hypothetical protein